MASNFSEFYVQLWDVRKGLPIDDDTGLFCVLQADVPLKQTAYSDDTGTALTQPATMTNGIIQFWTASSTTTVDLSVLTAKGKSYFIQGLTKSQHRIDVDPYREHYTLVGSWAILTSMADAVVSAVFAPQSGGLPVGIKIRDVYVHKTQAATGVGGGAINLHFGVSGDPDGFVVSATASVTGYEWNSLNYTTATGTVPGTALVSSEQRGGALIFAFGTGLNTITTAGVRGFAFKLPYMITLVTTTNNLVFQIAGTSGSTTASGRGYVYYEYDIVPTQGN